MSQNAREKSNPKDTPTSEQQQKEPPITGVSPDDPITVKPTTPSKPSR